MARKRGVLHEDEKQLINKLIDSGRTDEEIAEKLNRSIETINKYRSCRPIMETIVGNTDVVQQFRAKPMYLQLKQQFSPHEMIYVEQVWASLVNQFSAQDILATDEITMKDLIVLEILCNRSLAEHQKLSSEIDMLTDILNRERENMNTAEDPSMAIARITQIQSEINAMRATVVVLNKDFLEKQSRKEQIFKQLKATREQRLKSIEESKRNFFELIKQLDTKQARIKFGEELLLYRCAVGYWKSKLSSPYVYMDGMSDIPILNSDSVLQDERIKDDN